MPDEIFTHLGVLPTLLRWEARLVVGLKNSHCWKVHSLLVLFHGKLRRNSSRVDPKYSDQNICAPFKSGTFFSHLLTNRPCSQDSQHVRSGFWYLSLISLLYSMNVLICFPVKFDALLFSSFLSLSLSLFCKREVITTLSTPLQNGMLRDGSVGTNGRNVSIQ